MQTKALLLLAIAVVTLPSVAAAQTVSTFLGLFNICAGLMIVASVLSFVGGFIRYLVVLGTERRIEGLKLMHWGVTILFVLVALLGIINILQGPISFIIGIVVILFLCFAVVLALAKGNKASPPVEH
jgi:hypothetical protein